METMVAVLVQGGRHGSMYQKSKSMTYLRIRRWRRAMSTGVGLVVSPQRHVSDRAVVVHLGALGARWCHATIIRIRQLVLLFRGEVAC